MIASYKFRKQSTALKHNPQASLSQKTSSSFYKASMNLQKNPIKPRNQFTSQLSKRNTLDTLEQTLYPKSKFPQSTKLPFKARIRTSSQKSRRIFEKSVYLTDPLSNTPFEFEVRLNQPITTLEDTTENESVIQIPGSDIGEAPAKLLTPFAIKNTATRHKKKIDIQAFRETENLAAVMIQKFWRGFKERKGFLVIKEAKRLNLAEEKAKKAIEEYEKLKKVMLMKRRRFMLFKG